MSSLASQDDTWAQELLDTEQNVIDWSRDFLAEHTATLGGPDPVLTRSGGHHHHSEVIPGLEDKWAEQYLEDVPSLLTESDAEAEQSMAEAILPHTLLIVVCLQEYASGFFRGRSWAKTVSSCAMAWAPQGGLEFAKSIFFPF